MKTKKLLLNHMLDIGGVVTLNNLYSPTATSYKGALLHSRKLVKSYIEGGLIEKIMPIGKPGNKSHEVFYCLTKKGADYIGRSSEYKYKKYQKSPNNVMHESAKFDIALSFLRQYPFHNFTMYYSSSFYGVRPDILIRVEYTYPKRMTKFLLIELERKKSVDRIYKEKLLRYEAMFANIEKNKSHNEQQFTVLFVCTDIWFNVFLRPQQYDDPYVVQKIERVNNMVKQLIHNYCKHLPEHRYRFTGFHNFAKLHEAIWQTPLGNRVQLNL